MINHIPMMLARVQLKIRPGKTYSMGFKTKNIYIMSTRFGNIDLLWAKKI